jgi:peptidoglycan hydrolase-like protein with peptidoglycan-binding domain
MKKYITIALLALALILSPLSSSAQSTTGTSCVNITRSLALRSRDGAADKQVTTLQKFLVSYGYLAEAPTGYFGVLTMQAVKAFQKAYRITPTGNVGPITQQKIRNLTCGTATVPPSADCPHGARFNARSGARCPGADTVYSQTNVKVIPNTYALSVAGNNGYGALSSFTFDAALSGNYASITIPQAIRDLVRNKVSGNQITIPTGTYQFVLSDKNGNPLQKRYITVPSLPEGTYNVSVNNRTFAIKVIASNSSAITVSVPPYLTALVQSSLNAGKIVVSLGNYRIVAGNRIIDINLSR